MSAFSDLFAKKHPKDTWAWTVWMNLMSLMILMISSNRFATFFPFFLVLINNIDGVIIYHCEKSSLFAKKTDQF